MKKSVLDYNFPQDLKNMNNNELELLAIQIREFLVDNISLTGGHLASNLGSVELSIAIHKFFNTPIDKVVWDVGHQTYVHKILTGRAKFFPTLRQIDGLSGFPKKSESIYDVFDTGHSSNSISIATGFAVSRDLKNEDYNVIAVIGDGALTGGMAYEGLNNLGERKSKSIVIINDNGMSIGKNTGGLSKHLSKIRLSKKYRNLKKGISRFLKDRPRLYNTATSLRDRLKYSIVDGVMFEQLGFTYIGTVDGHNIQEIIESFKLAEQSSNSVIIHIVTKKGKGYYNAEKNPSAFHGVSAFDKSTGIQIKKESKGISYSKAVGDKLISMARADDRIVAISAAMIEGTGLKEFEKIFPQRTFDVGIAEAHAVTFAGSMALSGLSPFVCVYSTFLQRAYDQIINDVAIQNGKVIFLVDRAGNVGADGETHHGLFDISYIRNIPNIKLFAPASVKDIEAVMEYAHKNEKGAVAIRFPRGEDKGIDKEKVIMDGKDRVFFKALGKGKKITIFAVGTMLENALQTKDILKEKSIDIGVVSVRCVSPIDEATLLDVASCSDIIITLEDGMKNGGYGEAIASKVFEKSLNIQIVNIGWEREFIPHGDANLMMDRYGLSAEKLAERIEVLFEG